MSDHIEKKKTIATDEPEIPNDEIQTNIELSKDIVNQKEKINYTRPSIANGLSPSQFENRKRLSIVSKKSISETMDDQKLVKYIEKNQLKLIGNQNSNGDPIKTFERNRLSIVSAKPAFEEEEPATDDAQPIKLVLEDQSIYFKEKPIWSYLKAGRGAIISLMIFATFFLVHAIRLFCGNLKRYEISINK